MYLLLIVPGVIVVIFLLYRFMIFISETMIRLLVDRKHQDAEAIMYSGYAPPEWAKKGFARLGIDRLSKVIALRKLTKVIKHIQNSPVVENEEGRTIAVDKLRAVRKKWKSMPWCEISSNR